jgi:hypothetical protein
MEIRIRIRENKKTGRLALPPSVSLLRYAYDADNKRARQVVIGSAPFWANALPHDLESILTEDEKLDFFEFIADRNRQVREACQRFQLKRLTEHIGMAAKAIEGGEDPPDAELLWEAMDVLAKALERRGYERPKRERGRPAKSQELRADDLLAEWEFMTSEDRVAELPDFSVEVSRRRRGMRQFPIYPDEELVRRSGRESTEHE